MTRIIPQPRNERVARYELRADECNAGAFWAKVAVKDSDECWLWTAFIGPGGYGVFRAKHRNTRAHRVAYALTHGIVPRGLYVLHRCDNRLCVNPRHLWLGNSSDNMYDMYRKGRGNLAARPLFKSTGVCPKGHQIVGANVYYMTNGYTCCRECRRRSNRESLRRRRAARKASMVA